MDTKVIYRRANERDVSSTHIEVSKVPLLRHALHFCPHLFLSQHHDSQQAKERTAFYKTRSLRHEIRRYFGRDCVGIQAKPVLMTQLASSLNKLAASNE